MPHFYETTYYTIFPWSLPNFYSMFIPLKNFTICSFIKMWQKLLPRQPFFFSTYSTYLLMSVPYMKAWMQVDAILSLYLHKGALPLMCNFLKILTKNLAMATILLYTFYPPSTLLKKVGVRLSVCPSLRLSERKVLSQAQVFTDPYQVCTACLYHSKIL